MFRSGKQKIKRIVVLVLCFVFISNNTTAYAQKETKKSNIDCSKYYYEQLDEVGKKIYNNFKKAKEQFWNNEEIVYEIGKIADIKDFDEKYYNKVASLARQAYWLDNPTEKICFSESVYYIKLSKADGTITMHLKPKAEKGQYGDFSSKELPKAMQKLENKVMEFVKTLKGSDKDKLIQIHEWIKENSVYDRTQKQSNTHNAYGAIVEGRAVCSGLAYAYKYIADLAGLDVLYVTGNHNGSLHAWNMVYVDGKWSIVDITENQVLGSIESYKYLFSSLDDKTYIPDVRFKYPNN